MLGGRPNIDKYEKEQSKPHLCVNQWLLNGTLCDTSPNAPQRLERK